MSASDQVEKYRKAVSKRFLDKLTILTQTELQNELAKNGISFDVTKQLGSGAYGVVYPGQWNPPWRRVRPRQIVVKRQLDRGTSMADPARLIREIEISQKVKNHCHLATTYHTLGPIIDDRPDQHFTADQLENGLNTLGILIVVERYHGGDLINYVTNICGYFDTDGTEKMIRQSPAFIKCVMVQILEAVRFLFGEMISHRDLAARNVMFDKHGTVKVIDYGLAWDLSKGLPEAPVKTSHKSHDSGSGNVGSSTPIAGGQTTPVPANDPSKTPMAGADSSKTPTSASSQTPVLLGVDISKTPVASMSAKDGSQTPTEETFDILGVTVTRCQKSDDSSGSDGSNDTVILGNETNPLTSLDDDSASPNTPAGLGAGDPPLTAQEAQELKEAIEEDVTPAAGNILPNLRTPVASVEKSEVLQVPTGSLTPETKQQSGPAANEPMRLPDSGMLLPIIDFPEITTNLRPLYISPKTEKLMKNWNVSDQEKRYPGGAASPDPVEDETKFMQVHKVWAEISFCKDLKMVAVIILYLLLDNRDQELTPKLGHIMMARFYLFIRRAAERFAENRQNPMQDIVDHPFLKFDPIQMYWREECSNVIA